ncbi:MAG: REP-associated tyrosine transposase [Desulfobaccales bacterium]
MTAKIRERPHRLPKEYYQGTSSVAITMCIKDRVSIFVNPKIVEVFVGILNKNMERYSCGIPVYCFMPDHLHMIITGNNNEVDLLKVISAYKQKTGFWFSINNMGAKWQKDFYDHVIKKEESLIRNIKYILDNPVRKGIVTDWQEYPFKGAIGYDLEDIVTSLV